MNRKPFAIAIAAAAALAAGSALADDITIDPTPFVSTHTRAEVQADLTQFRGAGANPWSISYNPVRSFQGSRSRAEVQAEFVGSREQVRALTGEDSGSAYLARGNVGAGTRVAGQPKTAQ